jgi:hypothetical protein
MLSNRSTIINSTFAVTYSQPHGPDCKGVEQQQHNVGGSGSRTSDSRNLGTTVAGRTRNKPTRRTFCEPMKYQALIKPCHSKMYGQIETYEIVRDAGGNGKVLLKFDANLLSFQRCYVVIPLNFGLKNVKHDDAMSDAFLFFFEMVMTYLRLGTSVNGTHRRVQFPEFHSFGEGFTNCLAWFDLNSGSLLVGQISPDHRFQR